MSRASGLAWALQWWAMSRANGIVRAKVVWSYGPADGLIRARVGVWGVFRTAEGHIWAPHGII